MCYVLLQLHLFYDFGGPSSLHLILGIWSSEKPHFNRTFKLSPIPENKCIAGTFKYDFWIQLTKGYLQVNYERFAKWVSDGAF